MLPALHQSTRTATRRTHLHRSVCLLPSCPWRSVCACSLQLLSATTNQGVFTASMCCTSSAPPQEEWNGAHILASSVTYTTLTTTCHWSPPDTQRSSAPSVRCTVVLPASLASLLRAAFEIGTPVPQPDGDVVVPVTLQCKAADGAGLQTVGFVFTLERCERKGSRNYGCWLTKSLLPAAQP